jgi:hypothetical protein
MKFSDSNMPGDKALLSLKQERSINTFGNNNNAHNTSLKKVTRYISITKLFNIR